MTAIKIENLSKRYIIGHQKQERYTALRDVVMHKMRGLGQRLRHPLSPNKEEIDIEEFWALRDINLEIQPGDRVGIIGRNGAGKSTLLKVLSRITEPTRGRIQINGRIASLLEVGTGFHPELSGRENIYLNGAILGMTRNEIKRKFDEIVDFSGVEKFLDTPVKRYSSGMYVRLAFAVAAHLEPEILIVDEVLAVGDAQFQKKCLGKMEEVGKEGRTVLFVSHNMAAIKQLCDHAVLLNQGTLSAYGLTADITTRYLSDIRKGELSFDLETTIKNLPSDPDFQLLAIDLEQQGDTVNNIVINGAPLTIKIKYKLHHTVTGLRVFFDLINDQETILFRSFHDDDADDVPVMTEGTYVSSTTIPQNMLSPGKHTLCIQAGIFGVRLTIPEEGIRIPIEVEHTSGYNRAYPRDTLTGDLTLSLNWNISPESSS